MASAPIFRREAVASQGDAERCIHPILLGAKRRPEPKIVDKLEQDGVAEIICDRPETFRQEGCFGRISSIAGKISSAFFIRVNAAAVIAAAGNTVASVSLLATTRSSKSDALTCVSHISVRG